MRRIVRSARLSRLIADATMLSVHDKSPLTTATTLTSWARAIRKSLDAAGVDSAALFAEAGLDIAALGDALFAFLGISLGAFRIAGGILLFLLAVDMLLAKPSRQRTTPEETEEGTHKPDVSVFPLGIPMLAGPGSITVVMMSRATATTLLEHVMVFVGIAAVAVICWLVLRAAGRIERRLGQTGMNVLHRVFGLLLAAIAAQFVVDGIRDSFRM